MTFREKLADWISGGALSKAREHEAVHEMLYAESVMECSWLDDHMRKIFHATAGIQSGTAQKIHRMAKEALGE